MKPEPRDTRWLADWMETQFSLPSLHCQTSSSPSIATYCLRHLEPFRPQIPSVFSDWYRDPSVFNMSPRPPQGLFSLETLEKSLFFIALSAYLMGFYSKQLSVLGSEHPTSPLPKENLNPPATCSADDRKSSRRAKIVLSAPTYPLVRVSSSLFAISRRQILCVWDDYCSRGPEGAAEWDCQHIKMILQTFSEHCCANNSCHKSSPGGSEKRRKTKPKKKTSNEKFLLLSLFFY